MKQELPECCLPNEGLRFFHSLSNWVENYKENKRSLISWKDGEKQLSKISCKKLNLREHSICPSEIVNNTLYVPKSASGIITLIQIRNAYCHNNLKFDESSQSYIIELNSKSKIAGNFSLDAIKNFTDVFIQLNQKGNKKTKNKSKNHESNNN